MNDKLRAIWTILTRDYFILVAKKEPNHNWVKIHCSIPSDDKSELAQAVKEVVIDQLKNNPQ